MESNISARKLASNNYENPIQDSYHTEEQPLDVNMGKTTLLYLQPVEVHTDDNWLFSSDKIIKSFQHSYKDMDFNTISTNDGMILNYVLEFTASLDRNQRTYENLFKFAFTHFGIITPNNDNRNNEEEEKSEDFMVEMEKKTEKPII